MEFIIICLIMALVALLWANWNQREELKDLRDKSEALEEVLSYTRQAYESVSSERDEAQKALDKSQRWIETTLDKEVED